MTIVKIKIIVSTKKTILNPGVRTFLIILGIILAAILTWHSSTLVFSSVPFFQNTFFSHLEDLSLYFDKIDFVKIGEILDRGDLIRKIAPSIQN